MCVAPGDSDVSLRAGDDTREQEQGKTGMHICILVDTITFPQIRYAHVPSTRIGRSRLYSLIFGVGISIFTNYSSGLSHRLPRHGKAVVDLATLLRTLHVAAISSGEPLLYARRQIIS
jgi:hypothetical protein